ncbi:hypothetical protein KJ910_04930 [Patescibacteria group bacterium]|nr:hypothetical protein [Patescibacteria group bacterium]MBU1906763.1 hypothetical protein [Patescibacteria group bacterium]
MTENLIVNRQAIFMEIVEAGRAQGVTDREAYDELVESIIEDHRRLGEIHDDTETEEIISVLQGRFDEFKNELGIA